MAFKFDGKYRIRNVASKHYLHVPKKIGSGDKLTTSPAPEEFDESYSFYVKTVSGQLAVFTSSYKSYIAALSDITKEGAPLVWRKGEQVFQISSVTTADQVYNIRATTSDLYWSDKEVENQPYRVVFLKKGSDTDENHWRILPAA